MYLLKTSIGCWSFWLCLLLVAEYGSQMGLLVGSCIQARVHEILPSTYYPLHVLLYATAHSVYIQYLDSRK